MTRRIHAGMTARSTSRDLSRHEEECPGRGKVVRTNSMLMLAGPSCFLCSIETARSAFIDGLTDHGTDTGAILGACCRMQTALPWELFMGGVEDWDDRLRLGWAVSDRRHAGVTEIPTTHAFCINMKIQALKLGRITVMDLLHLLMANDHRRARSMVHADGRTGASRCDESSIASQARSSRRTERTGGAHTTGLRTACTPRRGGGCCTRGQWALYFDHRLLTGAKSSHCAGPDLLAVTGDARYQVITVRASWCRPERFPQPKESRMSGDPGHNIACMKMRIAPAMHASPPTPGRPSHMPPSHPASSGA